MDVKSADLLDSRQLFAELSNIRVQLLRRKGEPFLFEQVVPSKDALTQFVAGEISETVLSSIQRNDIITPCVTHVMWSANDKTGKAVYVFNDFPFGIAPTTGESKMFRISIGTEEVHKRIEELFAQKPDGPQALSALVFSSALKKVGIQMFGPNFSGQFTKEAERSLNDIVKGLLEIGGRSEVVATPHELNKINSQYATLVNAGMSESDLCDLIATHVMRRTCGWFFRKRGVHCVAVALGGGEE